MSIAEKLPTMVDAELAVLHTNAVRLQRNGTPLQRTAAQGLLPAIEAELKQRRDRRPRTLRQTSGKRAAAKRSPSTASAG